VPVFGICFGAQLLCRVSAAARSACAFIDRSCSGVTCCIRARVDAVPAGGTAPATADAAEE
jgi:carbamoylphosphate synthase small subunit